jgi:hypothetical protein
MSPSGAPSEAVEQAPKGAVATATADEAMLIEHAKGKERRRKVRERIAELQNSPWQPRCVARMFATNGRGVTDPVFTMQAWINLDAIESSLLYGKPPATYDLAVAALQVFGLSVEDLLGEDVDEENPEHEKKIAEALGEAVVKMNHAVRKGFAMSIEMEPPRDDDVQYEEVPNEFGSYLSTWACLVTKCGLLPDCADMLEVGRARGLIAAMRGNSGWRVQGCRTRSATPSLTRRNRPDA